MTNNNTILSNEDCYQKLDNYIKTNINAYNVRSQIKETVYDGITDQLLCTEGKLVESCETNRHGERKCRNIYSVSKSKSLILPTCFGKIFCKVL